MVAQCQPTWNPKPIPGRLAGLCSFFSYLVTLYTYPTLGLHGSNPFLICTHSDPLNLTSPSGHCCPSSVLHSEQVHAPFPGAFRCTQVKLHLSHPVPTVTMHAREAAGLACWCVKSSSTGPNGPHTSPAPAATQGR